ncbi:PIN domain-containing protein [Candidatus Poriferisodalis sp.]|uniref:PIN domain-containing protein n=1 Tax=Candidatus Poriferisodalis sp. TaxID=3101277 RepID=UPI003B0136F7
MFVLDAHVISELIRAEPDPVVAAWVASQAPTSLFLTAVNEAELRFGVAIMPAGARRDAIEAAIDDILRRHFADRILVLGSRAAAAYAALAARQRAAGRSVQQLDIQIAAIAVTHNMALATRNVADFAGLDLELIDPWAVPERRAAGR